MIKKFFKNVISYFKTRSDNDYNLIVNNSEQNMTVVIDSFDEDYSVRKLDQDYWFPQDSVIYLEEFIHNDINYYFIESSMFLEKDKINSILKTNGFYSFLKNKECVLMYEYEKINVEIPKEVVNYYNDLFRNSIKSVINC